MADFPLVECFATLQGEGRNTGRPCIFVRFAGCNLRCAWCDTDLAEHRHLSLESLVAEVESLAKKHPAHRSVIFTGGEPLLQAELSALAAELKRRGFWLGLETNATLEPPPELRAALDYIAASPKLEKPERYEGKGLIRADEIRIVVCNAFEETARRCRAYRARFPAADYFLSPCAADGKMAVLDAVVLLGRLNAELSREESPWRLSMQAHKLAGIA